MANNDSLKKAKKEKNDEFYTQFNDIQHEINAYIEYNQDVFRNKTILLPCDDPEWSNFTKFFAQNFERYGIKKLISTSYATEKKNIPLQASLFETQDPKYNKEISNQRGKIFILDRDINGDNKIDINDLRWKYLEGDGAFQSEEVKALRDEADIIITNPPFSLFREFVEWLFETDKKFLIIGSINSIACKEIFPYIKNNKMWLGNGFSGGNAFFSVPSSASTNYAEGVFNKDTGLVKFRNCTWYTNIEHGKRHEKLSLMTMEDNLKFNKKLIKKLQSYNSKTYPKFDNYDAIEVPFTDAIPSNYSEVMGVPISFLEKYNPEQFEIIGFSMASSNEDSLITKTYTDYIGYKQNGELSGRTGSTFGACPVLVKNDGKSVYYEKDGIQVQAIYSRIFIKAK